MVAIIPQTWAQMRDEVQLRMGKQNVPAWTPRMERFLVAAYYDIALTFYHYELQDEFSQTITPPSPGLTWRFNTDVQYPNGQIYSILAVRIMSTDGKVSQLVGENIKFFWQERQQGEVGRPEKWARGGPQGKSILFDKIVDQDYEVQMLFYRYPDPPDFDAADLSQLGELWSEHIMQRAMFLAAPATWRYDMSQVQVQTLQEFLQAQPQAPTKGRLVERAEVPLTSDQAGGSQ